MVRPTSEDAAAFRFRLLDASQGVNQKDAARVYYRDPSGIQTYSGRGGFRRRSGEIVELPTANSSAIDKLVFANDISTEELIDMGWVCNAIICEYCILMLLLDVHGCHPRLTWDKSH